jgi:hypothetical protein
MGGLLAISPLAFHNPAERDRPFGRQVIQNIFTERERDLQQPVNADGCKYPGLTVS